MSRLKLRKNAFTLVETMIVCTIFAIMVVWIILGINRAFVFMNNTKLDVIATNLAREWVEMVYNMRDTNWRKYSGEKDKHRTYWGTWNINLDSWIYVIKQWTTWASNDSYVYADFLTWDINFYDDMNVFFSEGEEADRDECKISFSWTYPYYSWGVIATWNLEDFLWWSGIEFYRVLRVYWVYCKNGTNLDPNQVVDTNHCKNDTDPKEMRFCVKVFYRNSWWKHAKELCSIMTNFME